MTSNEDTIPITANVGVATRSMSKKLQEFFETAPSIEIVEKYLSYGDNKSPSFTSYSCIAPFMTTSATTLEEQIANMTKVIQGLSKHIQERDS